LRRLAPTLVAAAAALAAAPCTAHADYDPPQLASATPSEQGTDDSTQPALSGDGRYLVFTTRSAALAGGTAPGRYVAGGVVRRDLQTGAIALVARGDQYDPGIPADPNVATVSGAHDPSVSADGRYIAFATAEPLVAADTNARTDVYVRDMDVPADQPNAYELVSAVDGADAPPTYGGSATSTLGADLAPRTGISADGRTVAFYSTAPADLPGGGGGTPIDAGQAFVRQLDTRHTILLSTAPDGTAQGGVPTSAQVPALAISADGSAAAWLSGRDAAQAETPVVQDAAGQLGAADAVWRRLGGPARRVLGPDDPFDPACNGVGPVTTDQLAPVQHPCDGPVTGSWLATGVALPGDGGAAVVAGNLDPRGDLAGDGADLVREDMSAGATVKSGFSLLTRRGPGSDGRSSAAIADLSTSPSGRYVAFTTPRTTFPAGLQLAGTSSPSYDPAIADVYVGDRQTGRLALVSQAVGSGKPNGTAVAPTVSDTGLVAFASTAANLVAGDGNSASDVFVAAPHVTHLVAQSDVLPAAAAPVGVVPDRVLHATATALSSGKVKVVLTGPGLGGIQVRLGTAGGRRVALRNGTMPRTAALTLTLTPRLADRRRLRATAGLTLTLRATFRDGAGRLTRARTQHLRAPRARTRTKSSTKTKTTKKASR
jgi:hypothetical protein